MRAATLALLAVPIAFALVAGCSGQGPARSEDPSPSAAPVPLMPDAPIQLAGCSSTHSFFDSAPQAFEGFVPEGFTMASGTAPGSARVIVFAWQCNGTSELWAALLVVPPSEWRNATVPIDAVVLQGFTTNATHAGWYASWGLAERLVHATSSTSDGVRSAQAERKTIELATTALRYHVTTTLTVSTSPYDAALYRFWIQNGTKATSYVESANGPGQSVGTGIAEFGQEGDPAAPPVTAGVGHRVDGVAIHERLVQLPAAPQPTPTTSPV